MNSISSTTTAQLPVRFVLNRYARNETDKRNDELARQRAVKRRAQHEVEMLAIEYSRVMLEKTIFEALDPATDPALRAKLREQVLNRGVGRVKEQTDDDAAKKHKGGTASEFLEILAAISSSHAKIDYTPRVERDITATNTEVEAERFLSDLAGDRGVDDDE